MTSTSPKDVLDIINQIAGIRLDIGCGEHKHRGFVGLDVQPLPGVDIVHDVNFRPWPLPDECVTVATCSHLIEHIPPVQVTEAGTVFPFIGFMDEVWRIMQVGGEFALSAPHGYSPGYLQDPTHCNAISQVTFAYFDPTHPSRLWEFYRPKPWKVAYINWSPEANVEAVLIKMTEEEAHESARTKEDTEVNERAATEEDPAAPEGDEEAEAPV